MEEGYFSLLWENEESYREWIGSLYARDKEYIADLNLRLVYEEIVLAGRFGEQYGFEEVFLHPCARASTVLFRQEIMTQLGEDPLLYGAALDFVSCISETEARLERITGTATVSPAAAEGHTAAEGTAGDVKKKMISVLQVRYGFLKGLLSICEKICGYIKKGTPLAECAERLEGFICDHRAVSEREELAAFLSALDGAMPHSIVLNKDREQSCRSTVMDPCAAKTCEYTERLTELAEPFVGQYDFRIRVYQNTDISSLDKKIQDRVCLHQPRLFRELEDLYEKYGSYDISCFVRIAKELVFYLASLRFVRRYQEAGFFFSMPSLAPAQATSVMEAYDMTLGINLYRNHKGCRAVPNDYSFGGNRRVFILTGANQGGKTTFVRSIGLIQCMAQVGMPVPCRRASLSMAGQIHTHFSREDERGAVVGRFEQELQRIHEILKNLQDGDMVLLNETFTSTQRSTAVILLRRLLMEIERRRCCGGLVTHFYEVCDGLEGDGFYSLVTEVEGEGECKERTYKIREGESFRYSYAKDIAVKCGVTYGKLTEGMG